MSEPDDTEGMLNFSVGEAVRRLAPPQIARFDLRSEANKWLRDNVNHIAVEDIQHSRVSDVERAPLCYIIIYNRSPQIAMEQLKESARKILTETIEKLVNLGD